jgi:hypothetical protein
VPAYIALYKGPASNWWDRLRDFAVKVWTRSRYSHVELVIDGIAHSSSPRDGGVRAKFIQFAPERWDLYEVNINEAAAFAWFCEHSGQNYDWLGIVRFVFPFVPHRKGHWFCFEAVAAALNFTRPHKWAGREFEKWLRSTRLT